MLTPLLSSKLMRGKKVVTRKKKRCERETFFDKSNLKFYVDLLAECVQIVKYCLSHTCFVHTGLLSVILGFSLWCVFHGMWFVTLEGEL